MKWIIRNIKKKWHIKKIVGVGFGFALLISVFSSVISYKSTNQVLKSTTDLSHSHDIYGILKEIISDITHAESCERGYVITGREEYLHSCYTSVNLVKEKMQELKNLTIHDDIQQMRLELLEPMVKTRFELMEEIIEMKRTKRHEDAFDLVLSHRPKIMMNSIQNVIANMENHETELLETGTIKAKIYSDRIKTIIILGNLITFVVLSSSLIVIFIDISQRNYFEQELIKAKEIAEKSVQVKEHFLANVSHEIRTPMNAISGLTKILLKSNPTEKQKEYLDAIKTSSDILLVIINDILDLSKAEAGKMVFEKTDFKIFSLISSITDLLHSKAQEKNLKLVNHFDEKIPDVLIGDAVRLNQIILNLVSNAIKFTEKGEITLITKIADKDEETVTLQFTVKDTGIGIPQEKLPTIFESFTQASTEITRKYGGTGLGLNIVKELVELQDGAISVESKENEGSSFSFILRFPISLNQKSTVKNQEVDKIKTRLEEVNILLVEDNIINQLVAQSVLLDFGCNLDIADNGKVALEKVGEKRYDVILMDIQMPEMSGYEVTRYIRLNYPEPICNTPIMAMTANASKDDADKCLSAGMNDYISKPFDERNLFTKICSLVNSSAKFNPLAIIPAEGDQNFVNLDYLKSLSKGNTKFMEEVVSLFISQTPIAIENMKKHYETKNWQQLMAVAHKIKPSFNFMGIKRLEDFARKIEETSGNGEDHKNMPDWINTIEVVCNKAYKELKDELELM